MAKRLRRRTCDQAVVGSIPGRDAIKLPRSTQPSIRVPACLTGVMAGHIQCVGWLVTLCDRSGLLGFPVRAILILNLFNLSVGNRCPVLLLGLQCCSYQYLWRDEIRLTDVTVMILRMNVCSCRILQKCRECQVVNKN